MSMDSIIGSAMLFCVPVERDLAGYSRVFFVGRSNFCVKARLPKNLRNPRRTKLHPDPGVKQFLKKKAIVSDRPLSDLIFDETLDFPEATEEGDEEREEVEKGDYRDDLDDDIVWGSEEIEAIKSLFQGRIPQTPGKLNRERPLPLPLPHKLRPVGFPTSKNDVKSVVSWRAPLHKQVYKNPAALLGIAREIRSLAPEEHVSKVLHKWARFLRKGSLSLTIRELGHMGLPDRALQIFCWAQEQPHLYPDDRILASTVEVLARNHELKVPVNLGKFISLASRGVIEAMVRGFIRGGSLNLARKLLLVAKQGKRTLDPSVYVKLILELVKNPDENMHAVALLDELGQREDLNLTQQDCTAVMKICIRLGKFEVAESLFNWYKESGREPGLVMYTTLIHGLYSGKKYREALAVVWEMESSNCLFDLPAYRVLIKLFVAQGDLSRAGRYFAKMKEAGFSPTYDIYRDMITIYFVSGRLAKGKDVCREAEIAGFKLDKNITSWLLHCESTLKTSCI